MSYIEHRTTGEPYEQGDEENGGTLRNQVKSISENNWGKLRNDALHCCTASANAIIISIEIQNSKGTLRGKYYEESETETENVRMRYASNIQSI